MPKILKEQKILIEQKIQISQFKANPNAAIQAAGDNPLAVMSHNSLRFYAVPVALYEQMMRDFGVVDACQFTDGEIGS